MEQREAGRLLCDCLSGRRNPEGRLGKLSPADGESLVDWALRFNVGALFYREIRSGNVPAALIPDDGRNRLRDAYRTLATKNTLYLLDVIKVLKTLSENHLPVIALKGLSLIKNVYGDIALRPMSDMDLLVKEEDLPQAGRILLTLGYQQHFPAWESLSRTFHHLPPFASKSGAVIELHWNIVTPDSPIKVDLDGLWERACLIQVDPVEVRAFSPEDLFLHLCIHACFHLQTGLDLIRFCDLAGLIKTEAYKIDWQIVLKRAAQWRAQKCVYLMLLLVRELLGAAPPDEIMSKMKPDDYQPDYFDEALEQILHISPSGQLMMQRIGSLLKMKKAKGIKGKVTTLLKGAFPSKELLARMYPVSVSGPKIYLYYLFRLGRLMAYSMIVFLRLFRRDPSVIQAVHQGHRAGAVSDWMFS